MATASPWRRTPLVLDDGATRRRARRRGPHRGTGAWAQQLRGRIGDAVGVPAHHVLLNSQHTHAAPPTPGWEKIGGDADWNDEETRYGDAVGDLLVSVAVEAARTLRPALLGLGRTTVEEITVNRRQRYEGGTILGWNPDELCDRDVAVIRLDDTDGRAICTVVAFAAHPVVVGPGRARGVVGLHRPPAGARARLDGRRLCVPPGLRREHRSVRVVPHRPGGRSGRSASGWHWRRSRPGRPAPLAPSRPEQMPFASAIPMAIWRHVPTGEQDVTLAAVERRVELPLLEPPTLEEIQRLRAELEQRVVDLQAAGEPRTTWNPVVLHVRWAKAVEQRVADGTVERSVEVPVQALRIGDAVHHGLAVRAVLRTRGSR